MKDVNKEYYLMKNGVKPDGNILKAFEEFNTESESELRKEYKIMGKTLPFLIFILSCCVILIGLNVWKIIDKESLLYFIQN